MLCIICAQIMIYRVFRIWNDAPIIQLSRRGASSSALLPLKHVKSSCCCTPTETVSPRCPQSTLIGAVAPDLRPLTLPATTGGYHCYKFQSAQQALTTILCIRKMTTVCSLWQTDKSCWICLLWLCVSESRPMWAISCYTFWSDSYWRSNKIPSLY